LSATLRPLRRSAGATRCGSWWCGCDCDRGPTDPAGASAVGVVSDVGVAGGDGVGDQAFAREGKAGNLGEPLWAAGEDDPAALWGRLSSIARPLILGLSKSAAGRPAVGWTPRNGLPRPVPLLLPPLLGFDEPPLSEVVALGELRLGVRLWWPTDEDEAPSEGGPDPPGVRAAFIALGGKGVEGDMTSEKPIGLPSPCEDELSEGLLPLDALEPEPPEPLVVVVPPEREEPLWFELPWLPLAPPGVPMTGTAGR
jgi:hypothetical protein